MIAAPLSDRQRAMLAFIQTYQAEHRRPPTVREIGDACGITTNSVTDYNLKFLAKRGYLIREPEVSRGIWVVGGSTCPHCNGSGTIETAS